MNISKPFLLGVIACFLLLCGGIPECDAQSASTPIAEALVDGPLPNLASTSNVPSGVQDSSVYKNKSLLETPAQAALPSREPFHWKGLILQSLSFEMLQNATRVMTADQHDRHILLNKPFWSDYWASLNQFNMRRWNDGDSIKVNYIGHPMQGAISGYIQIQNDPRGRELRISRDHAYWKSRYYSFLWTTVYSTWWEIGPLGETAISTWCSICALAWLKLAAVVAAQAILFSINRV